MLTVYIIANVDSPSVHRYLHHNIMPESESVWTNLVKEIPSAKIFKNKRWQLYNKMNAIMTSKACGSHAYHPLLQPTPNPLQSASVTGQAASGFQEADTLEQSQALEYLKNSTSGDVDNIDILMMPPPSFFDPAKQPPFAPSTPDTCSMNTLVAGTWAMNKGKRKEVDIGDDALRTLVCPLIPPSQSVKSACISMPEAI
ncbi:hypothetical protein BDR03DRAFT_986561 [Suillus americanus]|nr:hypothetical protein BDR03DRAFT_986561 [Suillus americanus]